MNYLYFADHLQHYSSIFGEEPSQASEYVLTQAKEMHALVVQQNIQDSLLEVVSVAPKLKNKDASYYFTYGVGRRLKILMHAYKTIRSTVPTEQRGPLKLEETNDLTRDVNVVYVNLRGILDCLAWTIIFEKNEVMGADLRNTPMKVDLLLKEPFESMLATVIKDELNKHLDWYRDLKFKRDPVAHRIPLYVPPAYLNAAEAKEYVELGNEAIKNSVKSKFEESDKCFSDQEELGEFLPIFLHHPNEGYYPIYPTIPDDIAHTIELVRICIKGLR